MEDVASEPAESDAGDCLDDGDADVVARGEAFQSDAGGGRLRSLYLSRNRIGDEGALALAGALQSDGQLSRLHLDDNPLGERGILALHAAAAAASGEREAAWRRLALPWAVRGGWCAGQMGRASSGKRGASKRSRTAGCSSRLKT